MGQLSDAEVYAEHAHDLVRLATGLVGPHDAADVVSSAMSRLLASPAWRRARDQRAYLYRSVVNEALMFRRSQQRRRAREARTARPEAVEGNGGGDVEALACLDVLSTRQRAVIVLTYWHDLDQPAVGALLGISRGSVARHLARAHARLREVMDDVRQA